MSSLHLKKQDKHDRKRHDKQDFVILLNSFKIRRGAIPIRGAHLEGIHDPYK